MNLRYGDIKPGDFFLTNEEGWTEKFHNNVYVFIRIVTDPIVLETYEAVQDEQTLFEWYNVTQNMTQYWFEDEDNLIFHLFKEKI
jgi:hypothetical protein